MMMMMMIMNGNFRRFLSSVMQPVVHVPLAICGRLSGGT